MLIIDSKDCENIDKALKKYKKKFEKSKVLLQLRERQSFTKPSVRRRSQVLKAVYRQQIASAAQELRLVATGADADRWLDIAQAFAGPPGEGRPAEGRPAS